MIDNEAKKRIGELEELADQVRELKAARDQRRPLLIEFCGSPKSGKSTTINALNIFLKRNGFRTVVLTERASVCPITNKMHPFFNIWTLTTAVAEIVKNLHQGKDKVDIIISDRGLFDALCWFEWLNMTPSRDFPRLDDASFESLKQFIFMDLWKSYLDLIYVFKVKPQTSIDREYATLLTNKRGSIMTEPVLKGFNSAIDKVVKKHSSHFRSVTEIRTDIKQMDKNPNEVGYQVTKNVLGILHDLLTENVAFFEASVTSKLTSGISDSDILQGCDLQYGKRDLVEAMDVVQPIPVAVITNKQRNKVLVVKKGEKKTSAESPERNKWLVYLGGHIRKEDERQGNLYNTVETCLHRELDEEIGESFNVNKRTKPFLVYLPENGEISRRHLAICYVLELPDLEERKFKLTSDEFVQKKGKSRSGYVQEVKEFANGSLETEPWSAAILEKVFGLRMPQQPEMFR